MRALAVFAIFLFLFFGCIGSQEKAAPQQEEPVRIYGTVLNGSDAPVKAQENASAANATPSPPTPQLPKGKCSIDEASVERDFASHYYKFTVNFTGFAQNSTLQWVCDNTVAKERLAGTPALGMPLFEIVSCDFPAKPRKDFIAVSIDGVECGNVSTRG